MSKRIFILNGVHTSGKDTFVKYINEYGIDVVHYSYVDFTSDMLESKGINIKDKSNKLRKLLCDVNNALEEYNDIPLRIVLISLITFIRTGWKEIGCSLIAENLRRLNV